MLTQLRQPDPARPAGRQAPARRSRPSGPTEPAGYGTLADFSALHLLQLDACTKCGTCHEVCPANATGRPLSPRDVVLELREQVDAAMRRLGSAACSASCSAAGRRVERARRDRRGRVRVETIWSCMQCNACVEICPVGIEQAPIINQLRRRAGRGGRARRRPAGDAAGRSTSPATRSARTGAAAASWTEELDFEVKDARKRAGRRALVRRRLRLLRPALPARHPGAGAALPRGRRSTSGSSTTASATPATTSAGSARRGCSRCSPRQNIATLSALRVQPHRHQRPALAEHAAQRVPRLRRRAGRSCTTPTLLLELIDDGRLDAPRAARLPGHLPRPLLPGPPQRRLRRAAADPRAARLRAGRDAAQPRQLVLLRRRRRPDLDRRRAAAPSARPRTASARRSELERASTSSSSPARRT